jgi:hypothetical protein
MDFTELLTGAERLQLEIRETTVAAPTIAAMIDAVYGGANFSHTDQGCKTWYSEKSLHPAGPVVIVSGNGLFIRPQPGARFPEAIPSCPTLPA